ncbi:hypothetical protein [Methylorubrum thiocyanatum]|uniref:hypothetical protein n=1 Tax=Methylorubrum thiocyanatum TaxID=47958 RepID=UPI003F8217AE
MNEKDRLRLERDRTRKAAWRREQGMTPQSDRNVTRRLGEIADRSGVSLSTVKRHRRAGTLDALEKGVTPKCPDRLDQKCPKQSHREVIAELHAGTEAAQDEWLKTFPPWSMH